MSQVSSAVPATSNTDWIMAADLPSQEHGTTPQKKPRATVQAGPEVYKASRSSGVPMVITKPLSCESSERSAFAWAKTKQKCQLLMYTIVGKRTLEHHVE
jgi:hypothetical protein